MNRHEGGTPIVTRFIVSILCNIPVFIDSGINLARNLSDTASSF